MMKSKELLRVRLQASADQYLVERKMKVIRLILYISLLFFMLPEASADSTIKIGFLGPLTGKAAFLALDSVEVLKRQISWVNAQGGIGGKRLELIAVDDQYQTAKTVSGYNQLVNRNGVKVIFAITYGGVVALANRAKEDGVVIIDTLDCDDELAALPENIFCVAERTDDLGIQGAQHDIRSRHLPAAIIYAEGDPFTPKVAKAAYDILMSDSGGVVAYEGITGSSPDFRAILLKLKAKDAKSIFFFGYDDFGAAMRQGRELGITAQYYGLTSVASPGFLASAGDAVNGSIVTGWLAPKTAAVAKFTEEHKNKTGRAPILEIAVLQTHDMMQHITSILDKAVVNGELSAELLKSELYKMRGVDGLSGQLSMDPDGAVRNLKSGVYRFTGGVVLPE